MKIAIEQASLEQLKVFATNKGLTFSPAIGSAALMKKVMAVVENGEIEVPDTVQILPVETADPATRSATVSKHQQIAGQGAQFLWVNINTSQEEGGSQPVDLYCNGKQIWVPRGKWCRIREGYVESLRNAVEQKYDQKKDEDGFNKIDPTPRNVHRYPHSIWSGEGEPPKSEQYVPEETTQLTPRPQAA